MIEITITPWIASLFKRLSTFSSEYIDFIVEDEEVIVIGENKETYMFSKIKLDKPAGMALFRLPIQVGRQISQRYSLMRIDVNEVLNITLFDKNISARPLELRVVKSIIYAKYESTIRYMYSKGDSFGEESQFCKVLDVLLYAYGITSGIRENNLLVSDGVVNIDNPEFKFLADLGLPGMNIVIPSFVLNTLKHCSNLKNVKFEAYENFNIVKVDSLGICWKRTRFTKCNDLANVNAEKPQFQALVNMSNALELIGNLKLAKNRDQSVCINIGKSEVEFNESDILQYKIPISVRETRLISEDSNLDEKLYIDSTSLLNTMKVIGSTELLFVKYERFITLRTVSTFDSCGRVQSMFILRFAR